MGPTRMSGMCNCVLPLSQAKSVRYMYSITTLTPYYNEDVIYTERALQNPDEDGAPWPPYDPTAARSNPLWSLSGHCTIARGMNRLNCTTHGLESRVWCSSACFMPHAL